jgi:hypothetical protein
VEDDRSPVGAPGPLILYVVALCVASGGPADPSPRNAESPPRHRHRRGLRACLARELWKFCWSGGGGTHTEIIAHVLDRMATDGESISWWDRVAPLEWD